MAVASASNVKIADFDLTSNELHAPYDRISRAYALVADPALWVKDSRFENVSRAAVVISNERNATTQVGFENVVCAKVPLFARFRESVQLDPPSAPPTPQGFNRLIDRRAR
jgi:hypothetical protein